ncbi:MAG: procyclic acidic repetitive family protein, partial [Lachnospiraceae bacterium]|nr:procyclic acidic repetitive family protein [Lachnospiraceae bacterium]
SKEPEPTMTAEPSKEPEPTMTAEPSKEPEPTMIVEPTKDPEVATMAAVISKVEDGSIWIENGAKELRLSENVTILKDAKYDGKETLQITVYELFEGDEITITYSTTGAEGYTSDPLECEKIVVENSKVYLLKEHKISQIQNGGGMFLEEYRAPLWYQSGNDPESTGSDRTTKIIKNGKEISFDELKEGDIIRVSHRVNGGEQGRPGFTDFLETVIVLSE